VRPAAAQSRQQAPRFVETGTCGAFPFYLDSQDKERLSNGQNSRTPAPRPRRRSSAQERPRKKSPPSHKHTGPQSCPSQRRVARNPSCRSITQTRKRFYPCGQETEGADELLVKGEGNTNAKSPSPIEEGSPDSEACGQCGPRRVCQASHQEEQNELCPTSEKSSSTLKELGSAAEPQRSSMRGRLGGRSGLALHLNKSLDR